MAKKLNMQAALMGQSESRPVAAPLDRSSPVTTAGPHPVAHRAPSRIGKKQIGAWLDPDFDRSLLLIMAKAPTGTDKQTLIAEALNDLFRKYNVPVVRQ
jgi:hypothetical protein